MEHPLKLLGAAQCPVCSRVASYLNDRGIEYTFVDARVNPDAFEVLKDKNISTIPVLMYKDKVVVGYKPEEIDTLIEEANSNG